MAKRKLTIEDLAGMVQQGFKETAKQADMDRQFDEVAQRLDHVDARLGRLETDVSELRGEVVYRHEFEDALGRIKYLEKKLGIESGA